MLNQVLAGHHVILLKVVVVTHVLQGGNRADFGHFDVLTESSRLLLGAYVGILIVFKTKKY